MPCDKGHAPAMQDMSPSLLPAPAKLSHLKLTKAEEAQQKAAPSRWGVKRGKFS